MFYGGKARARPPLTLAGGREAAGLFTAKSQPDNPAKDIRQKREAFNNARQRAGFARFALSATHLDLNKLRGAGRELAALLHFLPAGAA